MMSKKATVCIQDKTGKHYNTICGADYTAPEIRNMQRHLEYARKKPNAYHFLDLDSCVILVNDVPYKPELTTEDYELLEQLGE